MTVSRLFGANSTNNVGTATTSHNFGGGNSADGDLILVICNDTITYGDWTCSDAGFTKWRYVGKESTGWHKIADGTEGTVTFTANGGAQASSKLISATLVLTDDGGRPFALDDTASVGVSGSGSDDSSKSFGLVSPWGSAYVMVGMLGKSVV